MKLFLDENISLAITERLRQDGHELTLAREVTRSQPDRDLLAMALALGAIVVTEDNDFGELVVRDHLPSAGVVLLRLSGMARALQPEYIAQTIAGHAASLPGAFTVITPSSVRVRPLA
jgi:predicted nuclease of predicted toxin-antitoxin system